MCITAANAWFWHGLDLRRLHAPRLVCCESPRGAAVMLVFWRALACFWMFSVGVWRAVDNSDKARLINYLTHATYWVSTLYFICAFGTTVAALATRRPPQPATQPWAAWAWKHALRGQQVMLGIAAPLEMVVLIMFWLLVWDGAKEDPLPTFANVCVHGIATALVWIDLIVMSRSWLPDRQSLLPFFAGVVYLFWNLGYVKSGNKPLYSILTWNSGTSAVYAIGAIIGAIILYFVASGILSCLEACMRRSLHRRAKEAAVHAAAGAADAGAAGDIHDENFPLLFADEDVAYTCSTCCCCRPRRQADGGIADGAAAAKAGGIEIPAVVPVGGKAAPAVGIAAPHEPVAAPRPLQP